MCTIPLDLERRFEQRWAARFSGALQGHREEHREKQRQQLTAPGESKREARRVELALRPPACERTARDSQDSEIAGCSWAAPGRSWARQGPPVSADSDGPTHPPGKLLATRP